MKILKYILYFVIALVVLFFAFGIFKPTVSYGHEITVDKPAKVAWAVAKDKTKFDQWLQGFKSIELISGEQDQVGSKYKVVVDPGEGQELFQMTQTLNSYNEYDFVEMSFDNDLMYIDQTYNYSESNGKTTLKTNSVTKANGIVMRSMFAIMDMFGAFQAQEEKNIEALKKLIEENTTDYYPQPIEEAVTEVNGQVTD